MEKKQINKYGSALKICIFSAYFFMSKYGILCCKCNNMVYNEYNDYHFMEYSIFEVLR